MSFTDKIISYDEGLALPFIRTLDNKTIIHYKKGITIKRVEYAKNVLFMQSEVKDGVAAPTDFITLDLETKAIGNDKCNLMVISAVVYDGVDYHNYFINDYVDTTNLIISMITDLFTNPLNHRKNVYVHNLSGFDSMFILNTLANYPELFKLIKKDDKIITIQASKNIVINDKDEKVSLTFFDSLSILPSSLKDLGEAFGVSMKGEYDHMKSRPGPSVIPKTILN